MRRSVFFRGDSFSREQNRSLPSRQVQEGANMRDSVFFGSSNCYEVALPEGADHIRYSPISPNPPPDAFRQISKFRQPRRQSGLQGRFSAVF